MTSSDENRRIFFEIVHASLMDGSFRKATLSKPTGSERWKRIVINTFKSSTGSPLLAFHYDDGRQVIRENFSPEETYTRLVRLLPQGYKAANARLETEELSLDYTEHHTFRLKRRGNAAPVEAVDSHNREKKYLIAETAPFLEKLGISRPDGRVRRDMHDKFRQIQKFVEIIDNLVFHEQGPSSSSFSAIDFGSGKHYLTFALYEHLSKRVSNCAVLGIEQRPELVAVGSGVAAALEWDNLRFQHGSIAESSPEHADLVVALHACDTATDDALAKAIKGKAPYICVAPCCHKYVRRNFHSSTDLAPMLRHGILEERFCEGLTDSLRVLALEACGYDTKLFEFISRDHTAKNVMITAVKRINDPDNSRQSALAAMRDLMRKFSIKDFYLDTLLAFPPS